MMQKFTGTVTHDKGGVFYFAPGPKTSVSKGNRTMTPCGDLKSGSSPAVLIMIGSTGARGRLTGVTNIGFKMAKSV
ncbi:MAG: hypothetical protein ABSC01_02520 [Verrucomicrobiota bacterium]|jgi:hypothetical protein